MGRVATAELFRFMVDCLKAAGANPRAAVAQAEVLFQADRMGHASHGLNRLEVYVEEILTGRCKPNNRPCIIKESVSTALVDANDVLGATASRFGMDVAINKAKRTGVGWVTVKASSHFGTGGWWGLRAANQGMIGMVFTNTAAYMTPTRSKEAALGTNPIAVVAPAACGEVFHLDMATTAAAIGKVEMMARKNQPIPTGWAQGPDGKVTTDAKIALKTKCLMPLGGDETSSGFKGYGLSAMVEMFCGISSGGPYAGKIRGWGNVSHTFVAIDPNCFAPGFGVRLYDFLRNLRGLVPVDPAKPVIVPGDDEKRNAEETDRLGYVKFVGQLLKSSRELASKLQVRPLEVQKCCDAKN